MEALSAFTRVFNALWRHPGRRLRHQARDATSAERRRYG